jgi:hypothetical protein
LRITHENQAILKRISTKQPHYDRQDWEHDYDTSQRLQEQIARYPKATTVRPCYPLQESSAAHATAGTVWLCFLSFCSSAGGPAKPPPLALARCVGSRAACWLPPSP